MIQVRIAGASVWGPGLEGWTASRAILAGDKPYVARASSPPPPAFLTPNERRRASAVTRLALAVAQDAAAMSRLPVASMRCVFGSASGDGAMIHAILGSLARGDQVSPTVFHNSVHNAAAGYWSIGAGSQQPADCLGCHDFTFAATLLKAVTEVQVEHAPGLLCVYDVPPPAPLDSKRPIGAAFGVALVLIPGDSPVVAPAMSIGYQPMSASTSDEPRQPRLRELSRTVPAARALPLLESLARGTTDSFAIAYLGGSLAVQITPCLTASAFSP